MPFLRIPAEHLDAVLDRLAGDQNFSLSTVLVGEFDVLLRRVEPLGFDPFEDVKVAGVVEGHADGVDDIGEVGDDVDLDAFGCEIALEPGVELAVIDDLDPFGCRLGRRLLEVEIELGLGVKRGGDAKK